MLLSVLERIILLNILPPTVHLTERKIYFALQDALGFSEEEQEFMEHQIIGLEGRTEKQKNPFSTKDLKRYAWVLARLGGWKGYESKRTPGITTLWIGLKYFKAAKEGWDTHRDVSTR